MTEPNPAFQDDVDVPTGEPVRRAAALLKQAWSELEQGASNRNHAYHHAVVTTMPLADSTGDEADRFPQSRTVVLRWADRQTRVIGCHTDVRCPKVAQVRANPATTWILYDPQSRVQLRIGGSSTIHSDDAFADERWQASALTSRRCYLAGSAPSSTVDGPDPNLPDDLLHRAPTEAEAAPGRVNFAALATRIESLEVLHLTHDGHERIRFTWSKQAPSSTAVPVHDAWGQWLLP